MATMSRQPNHASMIAALRQMLVARGLDETDFEIVEDQRSGIGQLLGMAGGIISVRRRSTGELRVYAAGPGASWISAVNADLDRGYFRAAPDTPRSTPPRKASGGGSALWFF